jgi:hypothetical protein
MRRLRERTESYRHPTRHHPTNATASLRHQVLSFEFAVPSWHRSELSEPPRGFVSVRVISWIVLKRLDKKRSTKLHETTRNTCRTFKGEFKNCNVVAAVRGNKDFLLPLGGVRGGLVTPISFLSCRKHQPSPSGFVLMISAHRGFVDATYQTTKSIRSQALSPTLSQGEREIGRLHLQIEFANLQFQTSNSKLYRSCPFVLG